MSVPTNNRTPFRAMAVGLIVVAVACVALTIYWLAVKSTFLASHYGHQPKHALVAGIVAVVALIGAGILWRQELLIGARICWRQIRAYRRSGGSR